MDFKVQESLTAVGWTFTGPLMRFFGRPTRQPNRPIKWPVLIAYSLKEIYKAD